MLLCLLTVHSVPEEVPLNVRVCYGWNQWNQWNQRRDGAERTAPSSSAPPLRSVSPPAGQTSSSQLISRKNLSALSVLELHDAAETFWFCSKQKEISPSFFLFFYFRCVRTTAARTTSSRTGGDFLINLKV